MTVPRRTSAEHGPGNQDAGLLASDSRPSEEELRELSDPDDLGFPGFGDGWSQCRPKFAFVLDQIRGTGAPLSVAELLENLTARTPEPEPDLEAEP